MTRLRFPDGVGADSFSFYEKNAPMGTPDWVRRVNVSTSDGIIDYVVADDEATIVWLANLAALEMHVPQWTVSSATPVGRHHQPPGAGTASWGAAGQPRRRRPGSWSRHDHRRERASGADRGCQAGRGRHDPDRANLG